MRGWHQDAASRANVEAEHRRRVEVCEEHEDVVLLLASAKMLDQQQTLMVWIAVYPAEPIHDPPRPVV